MSVDVSMNMKLSDALRIAEELGCVVRWGKGGEVLVFHAVWSRYMTLNSRRKDAQTCFISKLRKLQKQVAK